MTLVEVLMVVFIIGLTTGLVVMTVPDRRASTETTARHLSGVIEQAREQAIFTGQPVGLLLEDDVYDIAVWRDPVWIERGRLEELPGRIEVDLRYETQIERPDAWPDLVFDPTGLVDPVTISIRSAQADIDLVIGSSGEVRFEQR